MLGICLTALLMCTTVQARNIDVKTAQRVGAHFLSAQMGTKALQPMDMTLVYQIDNETQQVPAVYMFNYGEKGYVVVAASDAVNPIVAYSTEGRLDADNMPPSFLNWMTMRADEVSYAQNNAEEVQADAAVEAEWNRLQDGQLPYFGSNKAVKILVTSKWSQENPYNKYCPVVSHNGSNYRAPVGCVALAMAQIMYYWKYPSTGLGSSSYKASKPNQTLTVNYGDSYYDFASMKDSVLLSGSGRTSTSSINAIALLCYHAGVSVEMDYDWDGSGVASSITCRYTARALKNYFKYAKAYETRRAYFRNDTAWVDTLRGEIKAGRPVFYTGFSTTNQAGKDAGHAFVCDGYNSINGYFHFNWGWGGYADGWCNVMTSNLVAGSYTFALQQQVVMGIQPPKDSIGGGSTLAIEDVAEEQLPIYPNPASNYVNVPYSLNAAADMQVYSISGRLMQSVRLETTTGEYKLDVSSYPQGVYVCRLNGNVRRFVVR